MINVTWHNIFSTIVDLLKTFHRKNELIKTLPIYFGWPTLFWRSCPTQLVWCQKEVNCVLKLFVYVVLNYSKRNSVTDCSKLIWFWRLKDLCKKQQVIPILSNQAGLPEILLKLLPSQFSFYNPTHRNSYKSSILKRFQQVWYTW